MPNKARGGGEVERFETGMEELLDLAEASGPPDVPQDFGNFPPESTSTGTRQPPARRREPERLQTADEEMLERSVRGEQVGKRTERPADEPTLEAEDDDEQPTPRRARRDEPEPKDDEPADDSAGGEDDQADDDAEQDATDEVRETRGRREPAYVREMRVREEARERELAELRGQVSVLLRGGRAADQPPADQPPPGLEPITMENVLPFRIGADFIQALRNGDENHAAQLVQAAFQVGLYNLGTKLAAHYQAAEAQRPRPEAIIAQREALRAARDETTRAFYKAHPYLSQERHGELVEMVSARVKQQFETQRGGAGFTAKDWMDETARQTARLAGISRRSTSRGARGIERDLERGERQGFRPAHSETSVGSGRVNGKGRLSPLQKEMLDLLRA